MRPRDVVLALKSLSIGEFIEIPCPRNVSGYRSAMASMCGTIHFAARKSMDGLTIRFYRTGEWGAWRNGKTTEEARRIAKSIPVVWHDLPSRLAKSPPIYWFGLLGGSLGPSMHRKKAEKLVWPCGFKGCPFPRSDGEFCFRHTHFEEIAYLLEGRRIDLNDIYPSEKAKVPSLSVMHGYELGGNDFIFEYRGRKKWDLPRSDGKQQFNRTRHRVIPEILTIREMRPASRCGGSRAPFGKSLNNSEGNKAGGLLPAALGCSYSAPVRSDLGKSHLEKA